jgi:hypothetical protein
MLNGEPQQDVAGLVDVNLGFTPAGKQFLIFDCLARGGAVGSLAFDQHGTAANDQRQHHEANDKRERLPSHGASKTSNHL